MDHARMRSADRSATSMHRALPVGWAGYPKAVFLVAFTELWERFSYWGMAAILVLFLTSAHGVGGFGWAHEDALKLYGWYAGAAFAGPLIGGWIANRYWGERRCIVVGGSLVVAGHICLSGPVLVPWLGALLERADFGAILQTSAVPLGQFLLSAAELRQLEAAAMGHDASAVATLWVYRGISWSFLCGLLLILIGTAFIKPTISSIVGRCFAPDDRRRDGAFGLFFVAIYLGSILGTFTVGLLGERVAWHWGFVAAAVGMTISLMVYLWKQHDYLGETGSTPDLKMGLGAALRGLSPLERGRVKAIACQGLLCAVYAAAFFQSGGLLVLYINEHVDRELWGWSIPSSWFVNAAVVCFIVVTPMATWWWQWLSRRGRVIAAPAKLGAGLMVIGGAYLLLAGVVEDGAQQIWWPWIVLVYLCFGISDTLIWPNQIAMTSRLAPAGLSAVFVGGWYVTIGIGTAVTGHIGAFAQAWGFRNWCTVMALGLLVLGFATVCATAWLNRLMREAPQGDYQHRMRTYRH